MKQLELFPTIKVDTNDKDYHSETNDFSRTVMCIVSFNTDKGRTYGKHIVSIYDFINTKHMIDKATEDVIKRLKKGSITTKEDIKNENT